MAKGIYVGLGGNLTTGDIIPKTWTGSKSPYKSNGITLTASGEASGYPATNACDGNTSTNTYYSGATDYWIKLMFPTAQKITKMKTWVSALSASSFSNAVIQGSNDGSTWDDLYTITSAQTALTAITLNNPDYYKYYQIRATSTNASRPPMVYEWQVSEYVQNPVARKVKKAYIGVTATGNNLVVNGDFSNGLEGWYYNDVNSEGALELSASDNILTVNLVKSNSNNQVIMSETNINTIASHVYYARLEAKSTSSDDFTFEMTLAGSPNISTNELTKDGEWHILSLRGVTGEHSYPLMISCYQPDKDNTVECRNIAVYDLTAMFEAGNEPTKEWCDANLDAVIGKGIARKVKKGYIGVGGVAQLFYSLATLVPFSSSRAPTSWTNSGNGKTATATNSYGEWKITASQIQDATSYNTINAFDNSEYSYWNSGNLSSDSTFVWCGIYLPEGVSINPQKFSLKYDDFRNAHIQGLNETTEGWENIASLTDTSSTRSVTPTVTTNNYYKAFRVAGYRYSSTYKNPGLDSFLITAGTLKIE